MRTTIARLPAEFSPRGSPKDHAAKPKPGFRLAAATLTTHFDQGQTPHVAEAAFLAAFVANKPETGSGETSPRPAKRTVLLRRRAFSALAMALKEEVPEGGDGSLW
jgi:hypothetical protein